jgi:hypothetical protein
MAMETERTKQLLDALTINLGDAQEPLKEMKVLQDNGEIRAMPGSLQAGLGFIIDNQATLAGWI